MTRPSKRKGTENIQFLKRIPTDIRRILSKLPTDFSPQGWGKDFITITTGTADKRNGTAEFSRISTEVEERFARLRAGVRSLSQKEAVALAGTIYQAWAEGLEDNPGSTERWDGVLVENVMARAGKFGAGRLMINPETQRATSMEERFGRIVDATLARECLLIDQSSRVKLLEETAFALDQAALKLRKNASGDYRSDDVADRFPQWQNPSSPGATGKKLSLIDLFAKWANHPEQQNQAPRTVSRYRGVFNALGVFLKHSDVHEVTTYDVRKFTDALMVEGKLAPRTVRDVHRAAVSSVFNWAVGKGIVHRNPAAGIIIKVRSQALVRPKELNDQEAFALVAACTGIADNARPRTTDAALRWCPLICLYTGARIGEVTQLRREDFHKVGTIEFIRITPEAGTVKSGKYRDVPLHPHLLELGLLEFVSSASTGALFFDLNARRNPQAKTPQSELVAGDVSEWARRTCLTDPALKKPIHAIRHRFVCVARQVGIDRQYVEAIVGHAKTGQNSKYGSFDITSLMREILRLSPSLVEGWPSEKSR